MKKLVYLLGFLVVLSSCSHNDSDKSTDYYIVGYDYCCGVTVDTYTQTGSSRGYFIISDNKKDTLVTYNLPSDLFDFSIECFDSPDPHEMCAFPDKFRYNFKIRMTYEIASETLRDGCWCFALYGLYSKFYPIGKYSEVFIKSIIKLNQ
jgi:hypothetical protein